MLYSKVDEILNKFGNLVNRTLRFKGLETLEVGAMNEEVKAEIEKWTALNIIELNVETKYIFMV